MAGVLRLSMETPVPGMTLLGLSCPSCARQYLPDQAQYECPACGDNLEVRYDLPRVKRILTRRSLARDTRRSLWRYGPLLPCREPGSLPMAEAGWTPLYRAEALARRLGLAALYLKDDGRSLSGSLKDRASAVVAARAIQTRRQVVAAASTGNAAASLACMAAGSGLRVVIFVPATSPPAKLAQILAYGAEVLAVDGTYDQAFDLCAEACREHGWYNRSTGLNPYTREGKKTCAFELAEQLDWRLPDSVFVPVGDGNILSAFWKGLRELEAVGLLARLPRLIAVQAEGSDSVAAAVRHGVLAASRGRTVADSIQVAMPRDGAAAVRAVRESRGTAVTVSDREILDAVAELAARAGVFAEPAGAAAYAGLKAALRRGLAGPGETAALLVTGNGLKDADAARRAVPAPHRVAPDWSALRLAIRRLGLAEPAGRGHGSNGARPAFQAAGRGADPRGARSRAMR